MEPDVRPPKRLRLQEDIANISIDKFANYDVFISHRGPDTKTGFVSFLYDRLKAGGLRPFLDCKSIDMGEDCWECIEHAIKNSPVAVVIFSRGFTESPWCMRELDVMLHSPGTEVLPIFYDVEASDVRYQRGALKDGFEKLERSGRHDKAVIEGWRVDLEQASKLKGWEHVGASKSSEADLVREVVGKIVKLVNKPLPLAVDDYVIGVNRVVEEIIQKLDDMNEVLMLGLWGMGGIGKSTLAKELYNQLSKRFDSACYIEDVTEKVMQGGVVKVQNMILKNLCKEESGGIEGKSQGKTILEERLFKKRILMVLDDVRESDEMEHWISRKMLREGSMCIVTSRNRSVFEGLHSFAINREVYIHDVQLLSSVDSERVFTSYATGGYRQLRPELGKMVPGISKACGGVPLVLKVCGALLRNKEDMEVWKDVLMKLNRGGMMDDKKLFECLRISYDDLSEEEQEMFLDIACGLIGQSRDSAVCVWRSLEWCAELGVCRLIEKALITVDKDGCLRMHDHLRDMGRGIEKRRARKGVVRRLWMPELLKLLKENKPLPNSLQTLIIFDRNDIDDFKSGLNGIDLDLSHMKELRIVILNNIINVTSSFPSCMRWFDSNLDKMEKVPFSSKNDELVILKFQSNHIESLPESFGDLWNLEKLDISRCSSLTMLPSSFGGLKKMRKLVLQRCGIQSLPESFGDLSNLEELDMSGCKSLTMLPSSFGELSNLEELIMFDCESLTILPSLFGGLKMIRKLDLQGCGIQSLPESFGDLSNLEELDMRGCKSLTMLPSSFGELSNLEELDMSRCKSLTILPNLFGGLKKIRKLDLQGCGIQSLPKSFGDLSNLEELNMSECKSLNLLPKSFGGLKKMRKLMLWSCGIQSLPKSFGQLSNLEELNMSGCRSLTILPSSIGELSNLEKLIMFYCDSLTKLPSLFGGLKKIRKLVLQGCGIESLPESFGDLSNLEELNMNGWKSLTMLPSSFGELSNLEELIMINCESLTILPSLFGALKKIRKLDLQGCGIRSLPESFGNLSNLEELDMSECKSLNLLPKSFGGLKKMRKLMLWSCGIQSLPKSFGQLSNLEELNMSGCKSLTILPSSIGELSNLEKLIMFYCDSLTKLPSLFGGLKKIRKLVLQGCGIESLPESFGDLSNLEELNMNGCKSLTMLPSSFGELSNLEELTMINCERLTILPSLFGGLRKIRKLDLQGCGIHSLPESFGDLSNLEELDMSGCKSLNLLPKSFGGLKKMQKLTLWSCGIQSLPESFGDLSNLEELDMSECKSFTSLPKSFGGLKMMRKLMLRSCGIQSLPESFEDLSNLEELDMSGCKSLIMLPSSLGNLSNLGELIMFDCESLTILPSLFGGLKMIRKLDLQGCGIKSLPQSFGD